MKHENETKFKINLQYFAEDPKPEEKQPQPKPEEKQPQPKEKPQFSTAEEFSKAYKELKDSTVSKEQYEKVQSQLADVTKALIDGTTRATLPEGGKSEEKSLKELAKEFTEQGIDNLEAAKRALKYRDAVIKKYGVDPMVDVHSEDPEGDSEKAQNYVTVLQECIDNSGGSNTVFTAMFNEKIKDTPLANAKVRRRA